MAKVGFFEEAEGEKSVTRVIFFVGSLWVMGICTYLATLKVDPVQILALFSGVEGCLIGLKLGQKAMEPKA